MASGTPGILQRDLKTLFESGSLTGLTDRDLVERVSGPSDKAEAAFEALVTRHGPMVLRVCRNVLGHLDDAEDAFQATFLVLVKQRGSIRKLDSVASWLYGVAARVAARARVDGARRRKSEQGGIRLVAVSATTADSADDLDQAVHGPIVQEEVRRLPERYRSVVLLCYWEGLTQEQAAHQLGCPIGTVRSRIARARDLLRRRLVRRGLSGTAGAVAVCSTASAPAAIPLAPLPLNLVRSSVQAAMCVAAGQTTAGVVPASVLLLVRRVVWSLAMMKLKNVVMMIVVAGLFVLGAQLWAQQKPARPHLPEPRQHVSEGPKKPVGPIPRSQFTHLIDPPDLILVEVLEALPGRPISGERLVRPDGTISLGFYGDVDVAGLTVKEAKEKIVQHMRKYLEDEALGLLEMDPETGRPRLDTNGKEIRIEPKDSDRVFVDVTAYNSKNYYVYGWVYSPGRLPVTGGETVLDALTYAGGICPGADTSNIRIIRSFPKGSPVQILPVDYDEITTGTDSSTNYQMAPNDRIVVPVLPNAQNTEKAVGKPLEQRKELPEGLQAIPQYGGSYTTRPDGTPKGASDTRSLERKLNEMENKLDSILKKLDEPRPEAQPAPPDEKRPRKDVRRRPAGVEIKPREQP